ncbi:MAG: hypothetical protein GXP55_13770 [Deltaproteobacteria bacterium]|nr:hypothetical protein [Deltaproteobacteria bacterium]
MATTERLDALQEALRKGGADSARIAMVEVARRFKRSWLEMAEALSRLLGSEAYLEWGYGDLYEYASLELMLKRPTVEKLLMSYGVLRKHAPDVLDRDGVERTIPALDSVAYFGKALREQPANDDAPERDPEVVEELRRAVFDEGQPVAVLRRTLGPMLYPKAPGQEQVDALQKAVNAAQRLARQVAELEGLSPARRDHTDKALAGLVSELDPLLEQAKLELAKPQAEAS